jgi:hypothetical protein
MHQSKPSSPFTVPHEFLESALHLYFNRKAYSAALHLAGAAEELLGKLLREEGGTPYLDFIQQLFMDAWNKLVSERPVKPLMANPCHRSPLLPISTAPGTMSNILPLRRPTM